MPEEIQITKYKCTYCGKLFDTYYWCREHEKDEHLCRMCDHSYYVYGCEFNCELLNNGKKCRYKKKKESKR